MSRSVILSPHPDDAVLSLWHVLTAPGEVLVVNVFGGSPDASRGTTWWDRLTGATDPVARVRERHEEDRRALGLAGRSPANLGFVDGQYREDEQTAEPIAERVTELLGRGSLLYAPATLSGHRDHRVVLAAARDAVGAVGAQLRLYADIPHSLVFGWPAWVTGAAPQPYLDPSVFWDDQMRACGLAPESLEPDVVRLGGDQRRAKREAIRQYRTQLPALEAQFGTFTQGDDLAYEVVWSPRG